RQLLVHATARQRLVWDVEPQQVGHEFVLESHTNALPKLSPDGRFLAYRWSWFSSDRYFRVYNAAGEAVYSTEMCNDPWEFSPDSRLLALKNTIDASVSTLLLKELSGPAERRVPGCDATWLAFLADCRLRA